MFPKNDLNILNLKSLIRYLKKTKPKSLIHLAGLSRPMSIHEKFIEKSISLNIIGTSNVVIACQKLNIKLVIFLLAMFILVRRVITKKLILSYLLIIMWSKLGGESAVQLYKNSLILRVV